MFINQDMETDHIILNACNALTFDFNGIVVSQWQIRQKENV